MDAGGLYPVKMTMATLLLPITGHTLTHNTSQALSVT